MSANDLNAQLQNLYAEEFPDIYKMIRVHATALQLEKMSGPFLMNVQQEYLEASRKILFVGMEAHSWRKCDLDEELSVSYQNLMDYHKNFMSAEKPVNSPFWWFMRDLNAVYQQTDLRKSVLWTNLSKIDINKKRPTGKLFDHTMAGFIDLLVGEVNIVKPDIMVIMTSSPNYQWHLNENLGLTNGSAKRDELIPQLLYKWTSDKLPAHTFQICHPNRLRFNKGGYKQHAESIVKKISELTL